MIVDSSALPEQVIDDVLISAFGSAGQRCSALRVLYLQNDIADKMIEMLKGAMALQSVGKPDSMSCDIGPVIDAEALSTLEKHKAWLNRNARHVASVPIDESIKDKGTVFCALRAYELLMISLTRNVKCSALSYTYIRFESKNIENIITRNN
jgi:Delta 1-pyrroline-5-carboxylate dehydrogenase